MRDLTRRMADRDAAARPLPSVAPPRTAPARPLRLGEVDFGGLAALGGSGELLALQHAAGNRAVSRLVGPVVVQRHEGPTTDAEAEEAAGQAGPGETEAAPTAEAAGQAAPGEAAPGEAEAAPTAEAAQSAGSAPEVGAAETAGPEGAAPAGGETASQPGPGTGTTGPVGRGLRGDARKKAIEDVLRASDTGTWAMSVVDKWKIPVDYEYGGQGSFHQGGKIYVNKTLGVGAAALTLMHEAQHANTYKSGTQADRTKLDRATYVKQSIADEAEAVVRQIEGLSVTQGLGADMAGSPIDDALKQRYLKAFYAKRDELTKSSPGMSTAEINALCRTSTRDGEVTKWFYDGTFVTSTNRNPYSDFYSNQWDEVHKKPGK